jgi:hypothetical protein
VNKVKQAFINQIDKQGIKLTDEQQDLYFNDFRQYCEEMEFTSEVEITEGALEYITSQIHYGIFH